MEQVLWFHQDISYASDCRRVACRRPQHPLRSLRNVTFAAQSRGVEGDLMTKNLLNRRSLLLGGAGIPLAGGFAARADSSNKVRSLLAEGIAQADTVVGPAPLQL